MKKIFSRITAVMLALIILSSSIMSCSSTTMIYSNPQGAKVYLNEEVKGTTPYKHTDQAIVGTVTSMVLKKDGYEDFHTALNKNEKLNVGALIGGLFLLVPFFWIMSYSPEHNYELIPVPIQ